MTDLDRPFPLLLINSTWPHSQTAVHLRKKAIKLDDAGPTEETTSIYMHGAVETKLLIVRYLACDDEA